MAQQRGRGTHAAYSGCEHWDCRHALRPLLGQSIDVAHTYVQRGVRLQIPSSRPSPQSVGPFGQSSPPAGLKALM
jgi:hypothetical protein